MKLAASGSFWLSLSLTAYCLLIVPALLPLLLRGLDLAWARGGGGRRRGRVVVCVDTLGGRLRLLRLGRVGGGSGGGRRAVFGSVNPRGARPHLLRPGRGGGRGGRQPPAGGGGQRDLFEL